MRLNGDTSPYLLPTDVDEINRLDIQHNIVRYVLRRSYLSPVRDFKRVLDVGCGTGIWSKEIARDHPKATVVGFDLVDVFFRTDAPPNCSFELGNLLEGLPYPNGRFDFVHQRLLWAGIPGSYWQEHVKELYRVTRPGGFLELADTDLQFHNVGDAGYRVNSILMECCSRKGLHLSTARQLDKLMRRAGFSDLQARLVEFPVGEWAGVSGRMMRTNLDEALRDLGKAAVAVGAVASESEYEQMLDTFWAECEEHRTIIYGYYFYGQRPQ
ncbi:methyltransferase type 11 [Thamnocephalis sphaerospora]|uniref:Methyltransferase type 11 n=1 Tax=Thamnocephalis sphaerospora TaxID=78915 RepID=A0A4P9XUA2_9FUNG|nr:methyltransferase type 11 [Thamnocephalis sphaerospora]|eukprot:RKP09797.1 methyltransferase type 11 [Thamnocephalis sphaerospora]